MVVELSGPLTYLAGYLAEGDFFDVLVGVVRARQKAWAVADVADGADRGGRLCEAAPIFWSISYFRISSRAYFVPTTSRYLLRST